MTNPAQPSIGAGDTSMPSAWIIAPVCPSNLRRLSPDESYIIADEMRTRAAAGQIVSFIAMKGDQS